MIDEARRFAYVTAMAIREIITLPDPRLREISRPVDAVDDEVRALMDEMLKAMYDAPGIGLAAIQIAEPKRVVVADLAHEDEEPDPMFFVNPELTWVSEEKAEREEGCLSIPDYFETVARPAACRVSYLDRDGRPQELDCDGLLAACIQHEIDHLNGVLFVDHISRLKRERLLRKVTKAHKREMDEAG